MKNARIVTLTKSLVDSYLAMNTANRLVKKSVVDRYVRDILAGNWKLTNQGIGISIDGVLLDGQHRLLAIKECGYPSLEIVVVSGLDPSSQNVVDQHAKRSARDVFQLVCNTSVSKLMPAVLQVLSRYEPEVRESSTLCTHQIGSLTIDEMFKMYEEYGDAIESILGRVSRVKYFSAPVYAAVSFNVYKNTATIEQSVVFLEQVRLGENLNKKMPSFHLRNYLIGTTKLGGGGSIQLERYVKTKKAFAAFCDNQEMGVLRV